MDEEYEYHAFISFTGVDDQDASWIYNSFSGYKVPKKLKKLQSKDGSVPDKIGKIYKYDKHLIGTHKYEETIDKL
jgi:hypothetical protein